MDEQATRTRTGREPVAPWIAVGLAAVWCVVLLVAAVTYPVYSGERTSSSSTSPELVTTPTSATLVEQNGAWVLGVVAVPVLPVLVVACSLLARRRMDTPGIGAIAWIAVSALLVFCFVTGFSIGLFVLPVAVLLLVAGATSSLLATRSQGPSLDAPPSSTTSTRCGMCSET